jgi:hypothetical protein
MSFPATFNIRYYKGDLYQFVIRPKNSAGEPFPISNTTHTAFFYISTSRSGPAANTIVAAASIDGGNITATIFPSEGNKLSPGTQYFYDVSIIKNSDPNEIFTLLTGTISITADITEPSV